MRNWRLKANVRTVCTIIRRPMAQAMLRDIERKVIVCKYKSWE